MQEKQHRKEQFKKTGEATGDLIGHKIADKITRVSKKKSIKNYYIIIMMKMWK